MALDGFRDCETARCEELAKKGCSHSGKISYTMSLNTEHEGILREHLATALLIEMLHGGGTHKSERGGRKRSRSKNKKKVATVIPKPNARGFMNFGRLFGPRIWIGGNPECNLSAFSVRERAGEVLLESRDQIRSKDSDGNTLSLYE